MGSMTAKILRLIVAKKVDKTAPRVVECKLLRLNIHQRIGTVLYYGLYHRGKWNASGNSRR